MSQGPNSTLFEIYRRMPVPVQNLACSLKGIQMNYNRYNKSFRNFLPFLKDSEWWSKEQIIQYQNEKLRDIVEHSYNSVPFYRRKMKKRGVKPEDVRTKDDLCKLPKISKERVKEEPDQFISERYSKSGLVQNLTSGTTGQPLKVYLTRKALARQWAVWWRHRARFGLKPGDKFLTFGARIAVPPEQNDPPFWRYNYTINQVYLSTYHINPNNVPKIVDWLNSEDFDFYTGYPSAMYVLASEMEEQGLRLKNRPKYVVSGADALIPEFEKALERVFGVPVTEQYGMVEACGNISKCEKDNFHLDHEFCILETEKIKGLENSSQKKMIFTGLCNYAMPLIRYDIGDYCTVSSEGKCSCGRESRVINSIDGRVEDFIRTPDGGKAIGMNQVFEWAEGAKEVQIIQKRIDYIIVRIVPNNNYGKHTKNNLIKELVKRVGKEVKIDCRKVDEIPRSESGKYRAVISNVEAETSEERRLKDEVGEF